MREVQSHIDSVIHKAGILGKRRDEVRRELLAHVEDMEQDEEFDELTRKEKVKQILRRFGSPDDIGDMFDRVYLPDRLLYYFVKIASTVLICSAIAAAFVTVFNVFVGNLLSQKLGYERIVSQVQWSITISVSICVGYIITFEIGRLFNHYKKFFSSLVLFSLYSILSLFLRNSFEDFSVFLVCIAISVPFMYIILDRRNNFWCRTAVYMLAGIPFGFFVRFMTGIFLATAASHSVQDLYGWSIAFASVGGASSFAKQAMYIVEERYYDLRYS